MLFNLLLLWSVLLVLPEEGATKPPNIILLLTDDQDEALGGEKPMQFTTQFFQAKGAQLKNFFVNTPVCCPSRATLISGRYPHNYLATDGGGCMHMNVSSKDFSDKSIGRYMRDAGYATGHFGKYLNPGGMAAYCKAGSMEPLPGFDTWFSMCNDNKYFKNIFTDNGKLYTSGTSPDDYLTSLIGNRSIAFMEKAINESKPFFAYIAPHAPHVPATPAPWYADAFSGQLAPRTPNWNYTALDHHYVIRQQQHLTAKVAAESDELFRNRWRSLLSVDDLFKAAVDLLQAKDQLENTYFLWTSDHGFQLGQFNLPSCKLQPYDHDIHVPFRVLGPGVQAGSTLFTVASMVDVAPTIIAMGGGVPPPTMDGHSFAGDIAEKWSGPFGDQPKAASSDRSVIEYWSLGSVVRMEHLVDGPNNTYIGVRLLNSTHNVLYVEFYKDKVGSGHHQALPHSFSEEPPVEYELFDVNSDPYQMKNLYGQAPYQALVQELHAYLHKVVVCSGGDCPH